MIEPGEARPLRLTPDGSDDVMPSWSPDGTEIYFASNRAGRQEVWKVRSTGGPSEQVTRNGGACVYPSADGAHIFYTKHDGDAEVWTVAVAVVGGEEHKVTLISGRPNMGLALSPDRQYLLYTQSDDVGKDLVLVNGFR